MNKVIILGTMTREPELTYTQSGVAICKLGIAYNEKYTSNGQKVEKTHFFDATAFGKTAENIQKFFHKGSRILIDGSLSLEQWQDQSGQKRSKVSIKVERFDFIDRANQQGQQPQVQQQYQQPQAQPQPQYQQQVPEINVDNDDILF